MVLCVLHTHWYVFARCPKIIFTNVQFWIKELWKISSSARNSHDAIRTNASRNEIAAIYCALCKTLPPKMHGGHVYTNFIVTVLVRKIVVSHVRLRREQALTSHLVPRSTPKWRLSIMIYTGFPHNFQNRIPWHSMTFSMTFVTLFPCVFKWYLHLPTGNILIKNSCCCANGIELSQTCSLCSSCVASQNQTNIAININQLPPLTNIAI